jgi:hypothetical protein
MPPEIAEMPRKVIARSLGLPGPNDEQMSPSLRSLTRVAEIGASQGLAHALPQMLKLAANSKVCASFAEALAESGLPTPWSTEPDEGKGTSCGLYAANGEEVTVIISNSREHARRVANLMIMAVNLQAASEAAR